MSVQILRFLLKSVCPCLLCIYSSFEAFYTFVYKLESSVVLCLHHRHSELLTKDHSDALFKELMHFHVIPIHILYRLYCIYDKFVRDKICQRHQFCHYNFACFKGSAMCHGFSFWNLIFSNWPFHYCLIRDRIILKTSCKMQIRQSICLPKAFLNIS